jgi:16S rRNA (adenine1518-N6/adenine1519-N6)-dimethyltransferase
LAAAGAHVTAIELDRHLVPVLDEVLGQADPPPRVIHADALTVDWADLLKGAARWRLVANLPYNVATPLVLDVLDNVPAIDRMLVMVQREVGERLAASPGSKTYGIPSVKVAYWATAEVVGRVSPNVFLPKPRVESAVVRIMRRPQPATEADPERLFTLVRAGFGHRRKMLRRSLAGLVDSYAFAQADVSPEARAEQLSVEEWGRLAQ